MFGGERGIHYTLNINNLNQSKSTIPTGIPTHHQHTWLYKFARSQQRAIARQQLGRLHQTLLAQHIQETINLHRRMPERRALTTRSIDDCRRIKIEQVFDELVRVLRFHTVG